MGKKDKKKTKNTKRVTPRKQSFRSFRDGTVENRKRVGNGSPDTVGFYRPRVLRTLFFIKLNISRWFFFQNFYRD